EVLAELALTAAELDHLGRLGLVAASGRVDGDPVFAGADLALLEGLDQLRARGLGELFPLAILEPYAAAIRALVRGETDLFRRQLAAGARLRAGSLDETAREATAMGERLVVAMRDKLMIPELQAMNRAEPAAPAVSPAPTRAPRPARPTRRRRS